MSDAVTKGVRIQVESQFIAERSQPENHVWFFAYQVTITNQGDRPVQLMSRHWVITSGTGQVEHVRGPGVVGKQPLLAPGESFEYTSFCPLRTPFGIMHGTFEMVSSDGSSFDAEVAPFQLGESEVVH